MFKWNFFIARVAVGALGGLTGYLAGAPFDVRPVIGGAVAGALIDLHAFLNANAQDKDKA